MQRHVADLDADARLAGDADEAVLDPLLLEQAAEDLVVVGAQETGDRGGLAEVGQEGGDIDALAARRPSVRTGPGSPSPAVKFGMVMV